MFKYLIQISLLVTFAWAHLYDPCHVVCGGATIRPGQLYAVGVYLCYTEVHLTTSLFRSGVVLASARMAVPPKELTVIPLKVPFTARLGDYKLVVEGLKGFYYSNKLTFDPNSVSITIQTSRPIYKNSQNVRFRILILETDLSAYDDGVEVYIIDSDGFIMRRWLSLFTNNGVASLAYRLPSLVKEGVWKIRVKANDQIEEQMIKVENYFPPLFEVFVDVPPYVEQGENVSAKVWAMFTSSEYIQGNGSVSLYKKTESDYQMIWTKSIFLANSPVEVPLLVDEEPETELKIEAKITDTMYGFTSSGFSLFKMTTNAMRLRFLSSGVFLFELTQPLTLFIVVENEDGSEVSSSLLSESTLWINVEMTQSDGTTSDHKMRLFPSQDLAETPHFVLPELGDAEAFTDQGFIRFKIIPKPNTRRMTVTAELQPKGKTVIGATLHCMSYSNDYGSLAVTTSTKNAQVNEYAVFHATADVPVHGYHYLVVSKNNIVLGGDVENVGPFPTTKTFSVPIGPEMAPGFRLVVFTHYYGRILADSVFVPVSGFNRYQMELTLNTGKDFRGDSVEIMVSGDEGAYISVHSVRGIAYKLQAGNEMTLSRVTNSFMEFDSELRRLNKVTKRSRTGEKPQVTHYFETSNYGRTPAQCFNFGGLILMTNLNQTGPLDECEFPCYNGGCYNKTQRCDGVVHCTDSTDEMNCEVNWENNFEFAVSRISRSTFLYDDEDGDWGWREIKKNDHEGIEFEPVDAPVVADEWYFNAFSVSSRLGFSIVESPSIYSTKRGFSAYLSGPTECRRGEQLGLRLLLYNHDTTRALVLVRILGSNDYSFVQVGPNGIVSSYSAVLTKEDRHILVYVPENEQRRLDIPIKPTVEIGTIKVAVIASTQAGRSVLSHQIQVEAEGAEIKRHTSTTLDLKNRAFALSYLDVPIEETPIVPYQAWRRYVFGSPRGRITITGDIIGPILKPDDVTIVSLLERHGKGTDSTILEFGVAILTLNYRRVTNTISGPEEVRERLQYANFLYSRLMKRFNPKGYFTNWDNAQPTVWITLWVLKVLSVAVYADWENTLYIDPRIFDLSLRWLITRQSPSGSFLESEHYSETPINSKLRSNGTEKELILTATALIVFCETSHLVEGETRTAARDAVLKTTKYIERVIQIVNDPYCVAIIARALTLVKSDQAGEAVAKLMAVSRTNTNGQTYWSDIEIKVGETKIENQRPFLQPRLYSEGDSAAVEGTSWALLVLLGKDGVTPLVDGIVLWLNSMKMSQNGFISITDTLVGFEALTEYANRARILEVTKIDVRLNSATDPKMDHLIQIRNKSLSFEPFEFSKVWGHVNILGRGSGLALIQMDLSFGVDDLSLLDSPPVPSFDLFIKEFYSEHRNKSAITIEICTRWKRQWPDASGAAVLEVDLPTGYNIVESEAEQIAVSAAHPTLVDAKTLPFKTMWFFDKITKKLECFNHTVKRWFPVANMTLHRGAILYEANARERYAQVLFNSTPLYTLSICEVCGSYQCPYCPYYNSGLRLSPALSSIFITLNFIINNV